MKSKLLILLLIIFCSSQDLLAANYIGFVPNKGQWESDILYFAQCRGYNIKVNSSSILIDHYMIEQFPICDISTDICDAVSTSKYGSVLEMKFVESGKFNITPLKSIGSKINILKGRDKSTWKSNLDAFRELYVENIYPGISLRLYLENNLFRYDFIVEKNAIISDIKLMLNGGESTKVEDDYIEIKTQAGKLLHKDLRAYQASGSNIDCLFKLNIDATVSFEISNFNREEELIIDPLIWSTFLGGYEADYANDLAIDSSGSIYVTGSTASPDFPATPGAYSESMKKSKWGFPDIFVSKFDSTGSNLIYSTFIGSFVEDFSESIAIDSSGNIYVTGYTNPAPDFPVTTGAYDTIHNGGYDAFILKLNNDGSDLIYSTFIGSEKDDYSMDIKIDKYHNAYITGYSKGTLDFPITKNAVQILNAGQNDIFASKLNNTGSNLIYSTFIGGTKDDFGEGLALTDDMQVYIVGISGSDDFPVTENAYDTTFNDSSLARDYNDIVVIQLDSSGSKKLYSTYIGGAAKDAAYDIILKKDSSFIICGFSESADYPITSNAFDSTYNFKGTSSGAGDIIISEFSNGGSELKYSTFIGGEGTEKAYSIRIDSQNNYYITGLSTSHDYPVTEDAYDVDYNDVKSKPDVILTKLTNDGKHLFYSTFIGGSLSDIAKSMEIYRENYAVICGSTTSPDFPVNPNAYDTTYNDTLLSDAFVLKHLPSTMKVEIGDSLNICLGDTLVLTAEVYGGIGKIMYKWEPSVWLSNTNQAVVRAFPREDITYKMTSTDSENNSVSDEIIIKVHPRPDAHIYGTRKTIEGRIYTYSVIASERDTIIWNILGGDILRKVSKTVVEVWWPDSTKQTQISAFIKNEFFCTDTDYVDINVTNDFKPGIVPHGSLNICKGDSVILDAGSDYLFYLWSDGNRGRYNTAKSAGKYWVFVTDSNNINRSSDTLTVSVVALPPKPAILKDGRNMTSNIVEFSYQWLWYGQTLPGATERSYYADKDGIYTLVVSNKSGCSAISDTVHIGKVVSVNSKNTDGIRLFPNPASNFISINNIGFNNFDIINITDYLGKKIFGLNVFRSGSDIIIDIKELKTGIYYISWGSLDEFNTYPFIKY